MTSKKVGRPGNLTSRTGPEARSTTSMTRPQLIGAQPGDSDPNPDEALRRVRTAAARRAQSGGQ